jgi:hypothetical protein
MKSSGASEDIYLDVFEKVIDENLLFLVLVILGPHADVEAHDQGAHQVVLPAVPQPFGGVAHHGLQKNWDLVGCRQEQDAIIVFGRDKSTRKGCTQ